MVPDVRDVYNLPYFACGDMETVIENPPDYLVFASNEAGVHGKGSAKLAYQLLGAEWGHGYGHMGKCYAIPTKDERIRTMALKDIRLYVEGFKIDAMRRKAHFFVTPIGTGLAGYKDEDIAPLFKGAVCCYFPEQWRPWLDPSLKE